MKFSFFIISFLFIHFISFGQIEVPERYLDRTKTTDTAKFYLNRLKDSLLNDSGFFQRKYISKKGDSLIVLRESLDSLFKPVFSTIILNSDDIINNGTAGSISFDGEKSTISLNFMQKLPEKKKKNPQLINIGISANSKNSTFNFYSLGSWNKGFDLNLGYTCINYNAATQYFPIYRSEIEKKRKLFMAQKIAYYYKIYSTNIQMIEFDLNRFNRIALGDLNEMDTSSVKLLRDSAEYAITMIPKLDSLLKAKKKIDSIFRNHSILFDSIFYKDIVEWEKSNVIIKKYSMTWNNYRFSIGQKSISLYDSTLTRLFAIDSFNRNYFRFKVEYNFNHSRKNDCGLNFFTVGVGLFNSNLLENNTPDKLPFIKKNDLGVYTIYNDPKEPIINKDQFKQNIFVFSPSIYFARLFGKNKQTLGFELQSSLNLNINNPKESILTYKKNFTTTLGLLLRTNNSENVSSATASLYGGFQNADIKKATFKEDFVFGIRVGVPFMDLIKKK